MKSIMAFLLIVISPSFSFVSEQAYCQPIHIPLPPHRPHSKPLILPKPSPKPPILTTPTIPKISELTWAQHGQSRILQEAPDQSVEVIAHEQEVTAAYCKACIASGQFKSDRAVASIFFPSGSADIDPLAHPVLKSLAEVAKDDQDITFTITGYADASGSRDLNALISQERAFTARDALVSMGISESRVVAFGVGTISIDPATAKAGGLSMPLSEAWSHRRIDIVVSKEAVIKPIKDSTFTGSPPVEK